MSIDPTKPMFPLKQVETKYSFHLDQPQTDNKVDRFLCAFEAILRYTDYKTLLDAYAASTTKCSRCVVTCPIYQVTEDPTDIPCYRTQMLLDIYKRYFTVGGAIRARFSGNSVLTEKTIDEMAELFYRCTACRRCTLECPMGLEHGMITRLGRYILSMAGISSKALQVSVREQLEGKTHNTSKVPRAAFLDTVEFLAEEMTDLLDIELEFPIDQQNRDFVFFCAVSDYIMEPDTLMGNAAVLYAAGDWDRWTIGSMNYDGINYGLFYSDWHLERIIQQLVREVDRLNGKGLLIGECGHATRSAKEFVPVFGGRNPYPVTSFLEYTHDCVKKGKITFDTDIVEERVTYHDPCNMARSGMIVDQPREVLRSFVKNFVEMTPKGKENYCCGGGGGLVSLDELHDFRMEVGGKVKADQIRATEADIVIAPCANCKKQLKELIEHYKIPSRVMGLHDLILKAIEIPGGKSPKDRAEDAEDFMEM